MSSSPSRPRFIADHNVGRLARWLRIMGFDAALFTEGDDSRLVARALAENRVILTRDTGLMKMRLVTSGRLKAVLLSSEDPKQQVRYVAEVLGLGSQLRPFTICPEDNQPLVNRAKEEIQSLVPPYVYRTNCEYLQCPACGRVYWRGTHWRAIVQKLGKLGISLDRN